MADQHAERAEHADRAGDRSADVVVLGAGPAGLATAWFAARRGRSVIVVERERHVGGLAASIEVGGQRVDLGSHRLHPSIAPHLLAELRALLGDELQTRPRRGRIRLDGRWLAFPLQPLDLLRHAPPRLAAGTAADLLTSPLRARRAARRSGEATFADAVRTRLGPTIARRFYEPYARKLFGLPAHQLSAELFARRVSVRSGAGLVRRVMRGAHPANRTFLYPARGFGMISEVIAEEGVRHGVALECGAGAVRLDDRADHVRVVLDDGRTLTAETVVSTIPVGRLLSLIDPPPEVAAAGGELRFRGGLLVYLVVDADRYTPFDAHYFPDPAFPMARVSEPKNYRDGPDPPGTTVLCAEWPATVGDSTWQRDDADLGAEVVDALERAGLPQPRVAAVEVRRVPHVYPVYEIGHEGRQATVQGWLDERPRLLAVGRQALFAHDNTHHGLAMAWAAAGVLGPAGRVDRSAWISARRSFAEHVVED